MQQRQQQEDNTQPLLHILANYISWDLIKDLNFGRVDETNFLLPTLIKLPFKVKLVACGDWHTIITDEAGNCYG